MDPALTISIRTLVALLACAISLSAVPTAVADDFADYDQNSSRWGSMTYKPGGTMAATGCGPTAVAMAVRHLSGDRAVSPMTIADRFGRRYHQRNGGSFHALIPAAGRAYGLRVRAIQTDMNRARRSIMTGGLVIALVRGRPFTWGGHFIVLKAFHDGRFRVSDPNKRNNDLERRGFSGRQIRAASLSKMWTYKPARR